ncbi:Protein MAINTENANCE OF MERISTEMS, partial [Bienertia sinuspersici]
TTARRENRRHKFDDSWVVKDSAPGGLANGTVIPSFNGHVARLLWLGMEDRGVLKCHSREKMCLVYGYVTHVDAPLISSFVERWQPDTNSFHLHFGEMTIMLHDVWYILRIPIEGHLVDDQSSIDSLKGHAAELFGMPVGDLTGGPDGGESHWAGGRVSITSIDYFCRRRQPTRCDETQLTGWLFLLLGCTLFVDKSGNKIRPRDIVEALEPDSIHEFSWGSAALAYLYRQPHRERHVIGPGYPRSMLWNVRCEDKSTARLQSIRRQLDMLQALEVDWMPYRTNPSKDVPRTLMVGCIRYRDIVEPYMPDRSLHQLGRVQVVPMDILAPEFAMRPGTPVNKYNVNHSSAFADWAWRNFPYSTVLHLKNYDVAMGLGKSAPDYLLCYTHHSHPRLLRDSQTDREMMPSAASRQACDEVERLISMWNSMLGRQQESQHDSDGSETQ